MLLAGVLSVCTAPSLLAQNHGDVGIRAQGMAGAFVAVADDATATWWNPAGLATGQSFVDFVGEIDQGGGRAVALGFPSLGLSYYRLNISQIQPSSSTAAEASGRQDLGATGSGLPAFGSSELDQFGVSLGQSVGNHLAVASTLKLQHARSDTQADVDVGAMAAFGLVRLGLSVRDLRAPTFGTGLEALELPRRARAGVAVVMPSRGPLERLTIGVDADLTARTASGRDERQVAGGVEAWVLGRRLAVRGGVALSTLGDDAVTRAFGLSVAPYRRLFVDGAVTRGSGPAGDRWGIDVRLTF